jgi:hypothetical protein
MPSLYAGNIAFVTGADPTTVAGREICYAKQIFFISVPFDIKPAACPNPINGKSKGVLPVAILGTEDFDVSQIDPESITLEGVSSLRWSMDDVATPYEPFTGKESCYDCTDEKHDGFMDLTLKFDTQEIIAALGDFQPGSCVVLTISGNLEEEFGGTPIVGEDVVLVKVPGDVNNDERVDMWDFYLLKASYGKSQGHPGYNAEADFDCNLVVDMYDFFTLKKNYGRWPIE